MIAYLKGNLEQKSPAKVTLDVGGVGYELHISLHTFQHIQNLSECLLHTCLLIREDAHLLYGFFELAEKEMFLQLINISGVGATTARIMLSSMQPQDIMQAIVNSDSNSFEAIKGIGKKTAERIILELKDKMQKNVLETNKYLSKNNTLQQDAFNALTALGIGRAAAELALHKTLTEHQDLKLEELIKKSLRNL